MDNHQKYEQDCEKIREANERLLEDFAASMRSAGLSERTINGHLENIDFYINEFLLYEAPIKAKDGVGDVGMFLGYWFIKKAMWASPSSMKGNATSLKKFYTFLREKGLIDREALARLKETIKRGMPEWLATLKRYDDPSVEDVWGVW
uniref:Phage integrase, N-terminal SAM-like domain n=1 Tax=Candidatus Kentrum sp. FM TaxID=2126340 RepID=A0A450T1M0_9GAMM|nr:MAG: hypothetical protein BECKFM1743C_GA0114222_102463 [Candidatus Kentron sp. FM]VFJ60175.1 MAG: hypothetical protein BECKFM1743A_GA0114220_102576 [Candidatus Kentron sp. FM]VFK12420.1 MAG: hypothetical protein BECKFM1743B_GA0114221_102416 [Candidatus Kentron sp. FM]